MIRDLPFILATVLCYFVALTFGIEAAVAIVFGHFGAAATAWLYSWASAVLMYVFAALAWIRKRKNPRGWDKLTAFRGGWGV